MPNKITYAVPGNSKTDPTLSAYARGQQAGYASVSCDWNDKTKEYNPYPLNSFQFSQYNQGFEAASYYMTSNYPWI